jgi:hypothetical protein
MDEGHTGDLTANHFREEAAEGQGNHAANAVAGEDGRTVRQFQDRAQVPRETLNGIVAVHGA